MIIFAQLSIIFMTLLMKQLHIMHDTTASKRCLPMSQHRRRHRLTRCLDIFALCRQPRRKRRRNSRRNLVGLLRKDMRGLCCETRWECIGATIGAMICRSIKNSWKTNLRSSDLHRVMGGTKGQLFGYARRKREMNSECVHAGRWKADANSSKLGKNM